MSGTPAGGQKVARLVKQKYGENYYRRIGKMGGKVRTATGGFKDRELASRAGRKGGAISRRGPIPARSHLNDFDLYYDELEDD